MGFFDFVKNVVQKATGGGSSLKEAAENSALDGVCGVYKVYLNGQLMKVGKAEYGLRQRFRQYYNGEQSGALKYITPKNRDNISVSWTPCKKEQARELELKMYDSAKESGQEMPWSDRR